MKIKGKQYKVQEIGLKIHLGYWYLYDVNHFVNSNSEICYGFLCFNLIITVEEIKSQNKIGFK